MRKILLALVLLTIAFVPAWSDGQFRIGGHTATPIESVPPADPALWYQAAIPTDETMTGWYWEVIFDHLGLGMHYSVLFNEPIVATDELTEWYLDWKGDFFLSYHPLGGGSVIDPFVEFGWGNVGTALVSSPNYSYYEYPDWEEEVEDGNAVALGFYHYFAAGLALDLNGFLLGAKLSYIPSETSVPDASIDPYDLKPFELSLFGGVALGGHRHHDRGKWEYWD